MRANTSLLSPSPCKADDEVSLDSATTSTEDDIDFHQKEHQMMMHSDRRSCFSGRRSLMIRTPMQARKDTHMCRNDSSRIRSRYLSRLGLEAPKVDPTPTASTRRYPPVGILKNPNRIREAEPAKHKISFESSVSIQRIPNRLIYNKDKDAIWTQTDELLQAAKRNAMEFAADGCDWRNATEEEDFICFQNELVHPAHMPVCNLQRQFLQIMYAQQQRRT